MTLDPQLQARREKATRQQDCRDTWLFVVAILIIGAVCLGMGWWA